MVVQKDYSVLPKQKAYRVDISKSPKMDIGKDVRFPVVTNDIFTTWTEGDPGDYFDWHSHSPTMYQILINLEGECVWYYKDNNGEEQSVKAGPNEVVYLPGGAENKVEVVGDERNKHIGVFPRVPYPRLEQLLGLEGAKYDPKTELPVGLWYDNVRDEPYIMDENAILD